MRPLLVGLCLLAGAASAAEPGGAEPSVDFPIQAKDTLIGLSASVFTTPDAWREIASINRLPDPNRLRPGQVLRVPTRLLRSQPVAATLASVQGEVRIDGAAAASGALLREGQAVETTAQGAAVVELGDGSRVRLPPSSLAEVLASRRFAARASGAGAGAGAGTSGGSAASADAGAAPEAGGLFTGALRLLRGSVEVFATKVLRAKPLELVTPTAVIGVRGTQYRAGINEAALPSSHVEVLEGAIQLDVPVTAGLALPATQVPAGFGSRIDAGSGAPAVVALLPAPDLAALPARFERPLVRFRVPGAAGELLRVQTAVDAAFDRIVDDQQVAAGSEVRIAGLPDGRWYVRARRLDAQGIEGYDANAGFVLKARPEPPPVSTPPQRAKLTVGTVSFGWVASVDTLSYRLQVARDADFADLVLDRTGITGTSLAVELGNAGSYHWRVASVAPAGSDGQPDQGPFGDPQTFELRPLPEPPQGGVSDDGSSLTMRWGGRPEDRQQVELASDPGFTRSVASAELQAPQWTLAAPRWPGTYYFRYRSIEPDGFTTPYSTTLKIDVPFDGRWLWLVAPILLIGL